jgi:hypothetical protein
MDRKESLANSSKRKLGEYDEELETIEYWLTRTPEERLEEVERLRREYWGEDYEAECRRSRAACFIKRKLG